jgi:hypothetical protein
LLSCGVVMMWGWTAGLVQDSLDDSEAALEIQK